MRNRLLELERKVYTSPGKPGKPPRKRRGKRRPGLPKRGPRPVAARCCRRVRVRAQSFDWDEPIELIYNSERDSYVAQEPYAAAHDYEDEGYDEGYEASAFGLDEDDGAEAFEVESFEVDEDDESDTPVGQAFSAVDLDEETLAEDLDFSDLDSALKQETPSKAMSDSDFAADLQAIITGQKTYDKDRGGMVSANPDEQQMSTAAATDSTSALPDDIRETADNPHDVFSQMAQHMPHNQMNSTSLPLARSKEDTSDDEQKPHDVFDRMGHNMSYANSFDLGSISLEQRFDEFDDLLNKEKTIQSTAQSVLMDEFDELLDNEKRAQSRAQSAQLEEGASAQSVSASLALDEAALEEDLAQMYGVMTEEREPELQKTTPEMHKAMPEPDETTSNAESQSRIAQETVSELPEKTSNGETEETK
ncbi:hypothetical protein [Adonisia turfae]|uniref:Uncharacterized protein n=1 Tax=Adonisia turfae CCMR0081 TaxID=2292702 RepID=A0A6M0RI35_9CYAN|nr:hypothetical protein [Adonisia turfae]NEZ55937.1 hypothetical protein [Adonisia turfae CCMR0081]